MTYTVVRDGRESRIPRHATGVRVNTLNVVHQVMLRQICRDYSSLPDPRTLTLAEIRFFYHALRPELIAQGKK